MSLCPCCSNVDYENCCKPYILDKLLPPTPEALMRSRYSAYTQAKVEYIRKTMKGRALVGFSLTQAKQWTLSLEWIDLKIVNTDFPENNENEGYVEFIAKYRQQGVEKQIHEKSHFILTRGRWYYVDGELINTEKLLG